MTVDGQWAELQAMELVNETNLEPGETQDIIRRGGLNIIIDRAYLPMDYTQYNKISEVDFSYEAEEYINGE